MFGFSFLNSFFLWGLAAASLPIIIHLIKRNRAVKLHFAAMRFLQIEPNKKFRSQRLKQIILLLMRILALAILALAFARPFLENSETGAFWGDQRKAVVILLDNSFSMGAGDNFQTGIGKAREILKAFKPGDEVTVMQFSESSEIIGEAKTNFAALGNQLTGRFSLSRLSTNYMQALQAAETVLIESAANSKSIYLISDLQKSGWDNLNPHWNIQSGIDLNFIPITNDDITNVAIQDVHISLEDDSKGRGEVLVRVKNYGDKKKKIKVVLHINQKKYSQRNVTFLGSEEKIVQFPRVAFSTGFATGFVELVAADEGIEIDNRYYFVLENQTKALILAVDGEPNRDITKDELFFVDRAINLPDVARYSLVKDLSRNLDKYDFSNYRVVILANVKDLGRDTAKRLKYYVRGGGGVILALGDQVNPNIFNRIFRDLSPASLQNRAFSSVNRENGVILAEVDYQHAIFRLFSDPGQSDPSVAQIYQYFYADPLTPESVLAYFDDGSPAMLERKVGSGKVILFTSTFDAEWTNLPVKAMFLPLLYQTLQYVASEKKGQKSYFAGNPVSLQSYGINPNSKQKVFVSNPSGKRYELDNVFFELTDEPGIYEIRKGNREKPSAYFAVNVDSRESDLAPHPSEDLQSRVAEITNDDVEATSLASGMVSYQQEKNQKLWRFAILLVIVLLVGETWLANRTYR